MNTISVIVLTCAWAAFEALNKIEQIKHEREIDNIIANS